MKVAWLRLWILLEKQGRPTMQGSVSFLKLSERSLRALLQAKSGSSLQKTARRRCMLATKGFGPLSSTSVSTVCPVSMKSPPSADISRRLLVDLPVMVSP
ncbi:PP70 [Orf virus]|uniref:PP70 n=1 Tax=Orf virus TaxID=10258 RepID=F1AX71_ORFV|nr:PP70 [Orf virus]